MKLAAILLVACGGSSDAPSPGSGSAPPPAPPPDSMPIDAAVIDAGVTLVPDAGDIIGHGTGVRNDRSDITVHIDCPRVDGGEIAAGERVVRARTGVFRACFQKELTRGAHDGASDVSFGVKDGVPTNVTIAGNTPSKAVADCTRANILRLRFPPAITAVRCAITYQHTK